MDHGTLYRIAAFTDTPAGGNPAGVWIGDALPDAATMQNTAKAVGFSETAFIAPEDGNERTIRYFSPEAEVSFCGHATIATGIVLGDNSGDGSYSLSTPVGVVPVTVSSSGGARKASLTSVEPKHEPASSVLVAATLDSLGWRTDELDSSIPPARAYAGAWHLVLAVRDRERLARLDYDFESLKRIMLEDGLTTLQLVWRERPDLYHARNPFPVGGVVEDPATGAAAAALGGYLRDGRLIDAPTRITLRQGDDMGRPSLLCVDIPAEGGIVVSGGGVPI